MLEAGGFQTEFIVSESTGPAIYAVICSSSRDEELSCTADIFGRRLASGSIHVVSVDTQHTCRPSLKSVLLNAQPVQLSNPNQSVFPDPLPNDPYARSEPFEDYPTMPSIGNGQPALEPVRRIVEGFIKQPDDDKRLMRPSRIPNKRRLVIMNSDNDQDSDMDIPLKRTSKESSRLTNISARPAIDNVPSAPESAHHIDSNANAQVVSQVLSLPSTIARLSKRPVAVFPANPGLPESPVKIDQVFDSVEEIRSLITAWYAQYFPNQRLRFKSRAFWKIWLCSGESYDACRFRITVREEKDNTDEESEPRFRIIHVGRDSHIASLADKVFRTMLSTALRAYGVLPKHLRLVCRRPCRLIRLTRAFWETI